MRTRHMEFGEKIQNNNQIVIKLMKFQNF